MAYRNCVSFVQLFGDGSRNLGPRNFKFARLLGENEVESLLSNTLEEEKETDRKLTDLATRINREALGGSTTGESESESDSEPNRRAKTAGA